MSLRTEFLAFDDKLASHRVPPLTAWWRKGIGDWLDAYERGHVLELWGCVGRGAAKSTALYKLATFFTLFGDFEVPVGERHFAVVLSRLKEEAAKGIAIIDRWLEILNVPHRLAGDVIELDEEPRGVRVVAASVAAASGWRAYFVGKDERSKWTASTLESEDADEIDTSAAAMTATHRYAPVVSFGSAWGKIGGFYDAITSGSDSGKIVLGPAPTWIAAPHVTEADCRRKEKNPRRFEREYRCVFQAGAAGVFDSDDIDRAFGHSDEAGEARGNRIVVVDVSSGRSDSWTWGLAGWALPLVGPAILRFDEIDGVHGAFFKRKTGQQIVEQVAALAKDRGANSVHGDQREVFMVEGEFAKNHVPFYQHPWTAESKPRGVETVARWLREGTLALPKHERMRTELESFEEKMTPAGNLSFAARGSGKDDYVALLVTCALADAEGYLRVPRYRLGEKRGGKSSFEPEEGGNRSQDPAFWGNEGRGF